MWHAQLRVTSLIRLCLLPFGRLGQKYTILLTSSGQRGCGKSKLPLLDEDTSSPALLKRVGLFAACGPRLSGRAHGVLVQLARLSVQLVRLVDLPPLLFVHLHLVGLRPLLFIHHVTLLSLSRPWGPSSGFSVGFFHLRLDQETENLVTA